MMPRYELSAVPYALSLKPGAVINGSVQGYILDVRNTYDDFGTGISASTSGNFSTGVFTTNSGEGSMGVFASITGNDSDAIFASTYGDDSDGFTALTSGNYSEGVFAYTTGVGSIGVFAYSGKTYDFYASGPGINYGPFTGAHEVKLSADFPENVTPGMIVSVTGETQVRQIDGRNISFSSTLPTVQLSDTPDDSKVLGVLISESPLPEEHWYINELNDGDRF